MHNHLKTNCQRGLQAVTDVHTNHKTLFGVQRPSALPQSAPKTRFFSIENKEHRLVMLAHQDRVRIFGYPVPQYFWFMLSGALCDMVQACLYYLVSVLYVSTWEKPTVCWTVSYILSIWARHTSHRILVFGEFEGTYLSSVIRMYLTYGSSIVFSTILSHVLSSWFMLSHSQALVCTVLPTGLYNYFMIRNTWKSAAVEKTTDGTNNV